MRKLNEPPPAEEEVNQSTDISSHITGYGITKPFEPPRPPDKPDDLPDVVKKWLDEET